MSEAYSFVRFKFDIGSGVCVKFGNISGRLAGHQFGQWTCRGVARGAGAAGRGNRGS